MLFKSIKKKEFYLRFQINEDCIEWTYGLLGSSVIHTRQISALLDLILSGSGKVELQLNLVQFHQAAFFTLHFS